MAEPEQQGCGPRTEIRLGETELEVLRKRENVLANDLQSKHAELREASRSLEDRNRAPGALLRNVQLARVVSSVFVIALVAGLEAYLWHDFGSVTVLFLASPARRCTVAEHALLFSCSG